jgi:uncharacterized membrane protein YbhN (UPF0104 family)
MKEFLTKLWVFVQHAMRQKKFRRAFYVGIILLSLLFIALFIKTNWEELKEQEWQFNFFYVILAIILYPLGMLPTVAAWHWLLKAFNVFKAFWLNLRIYALSSLPKHIPGLIWYVTNRTLLYEEQGVPVGTILGSTAFETAMLALSGFITAALVIPLQANLPEQFGIIRYLIPLSAVILALLLVFAPSGSRLIYRIISSRLKGQTERTIKRSYLGISLGWMFIAWIGGGILLWMVVNGITPIGIDNVPLMVGIWGLAGAVSLTIGIGIQGLGLREVTLSVLLSLVISPIQAITAAIVFRLVLTIGELLWVLLISLIYRKNPSNTQGTAKDITTE